MSEYDIEIALLKQAVARLRVESDRVEAELNGMKAQDQKRLRSAVVSLGAIVLSMGSYIWFLFNGGPS